MGGERYNHGWFATVTQGRDMGDAERVRAEVAFRGRVQGVGFRYAARHVAVDFDVTGYVENEADGSVEVVAEGERAVVEAFIEAVTREMASHVRQREVSWGRATGEFDGFGVRSAW